MHGYNVVKQVMEIYSVIEFIVIVYVPMRRLCMSIRKYMQT